MSILSRMFEMSPVNWRSQFQIEDDVVLIRPLFFWKNVPVGAVGTITYIAPLELEDNDPIEVAFDLAPYRIPLETELTILLQRANVADIPEFYIKTVLRVTPNDIKVIR